MLRYVKLTAIGAAIVTLGGCSFISSPGAEGIDLAALPAPDGLLNIAVTGAAEDEHITWRINGIEQSEHDKTLVFNPYSGEYTVTALAPDGEARLRIYGQDITENPPTLDGKIGIDEWNDPPIAKILPSKQTEGSFGSYLSDDGFAGYARNIWTEDALYFGIEVTNIDESMPYGAPRLESIRTNYVQVNIGNGEDAKRLVIDTSKGPNATFVDQRASDISAQIASAETETGYSIEARIPARDIPLNVQPNAIVDYQIVVQGTTAPLFWNPPQGRDEMGVAVLLPDPSTLPGGKRQQLHGGKTERKVSDSAVKNPEYLTPIPVEYPQDTAEKPDWLKLKLPWEGTHTIATGYGYEADSWTHQTIANKNSANDFYAIDIHMPIGTPILATAPGRIVQSGLRGDSYGNYVVIDHGGGIQSIYAHLDSLEYSVDKGEPEIYVKQGQYLGNSGQSGTSFPHLHFALHTGARASHSGANVGGRATVPEPISGYYGIRKGHVLTSDNVRID